ncbi:GNAT family N-acetyltransferase [bacterium]|nr:GNAT family N-acetyltransferase [bacterium]
MEILVVDTESDWYQRSLELRNEILRKPLNLDISNEDLSDEVHQVHFVAIDAESVVGVVVLIPNYTADTGKLRQMATSEQVRGKGFGKALVKSLEEYCVQHGMEEVVLHARHHAVGFYNALGYEVCSEEFEEVGIPHYKMRKKL